MPILSMEYKTLKAGDIRQKGDEVRHLNEARVHWNSDGSNCTNDPQLLGDWRNIFLLSHVILPSDLMVAEFRRPI